MFPRLYARHHAAISFYEDLQAITCERRVKIPETQLEAAK
jgi:hypothetical protein